MNNTNHYKQDIQPPNKLPSIIMKGTNGGTNGSGTQGVCPYMQQKQKEELANTNQQQFPQPGPIVKGNEAAVNQFKQYLNMGNIPKECLEAMAKLIGVDVVLPSIPIHQQNDGQILQAPPQPQQVIPGGMISSELQRQVCPYSDAGNQQNIQSTTFHQNVQAEKSPSDTLTDEPVVNVQKESSNNIKQQISSNSKTIRKKLQSNAKRDKIKRLREEQKARKLMTAQYVMAEQGITEEMQSAIAFEVMILKQSREAISQKYGIDLQKVEDIIHIYEDDHDMQVNDEDEESKRAGLSQEAPHTDQFGDYEDQDSNISSDEKEDSHHDIELQENQNYLPSDTQRLAPIDQRCSLNLYVEPLQNELEDNEAPQNTPESLCPFMNQENNKQTNKPVVAQEYFTVSLSALLKASPGLHLDLWSKCEVECKDPELLKESMVQIPKSEKFMILPADHIERSQQEETELKQLHERCQSKVAEYMQMMEQPKNDVATALDYKKEDIDYQSADIDDKEKEQEESAQVQEHSVHEPNQTVNVQEVKESNILETATITAQEAEKAEAICPYAAKYMQELRKKQQQEQNEALQQANDVEVTKLTPVQPTVQVVQPKFQNTQDIQIMMKNQQQQKNQRQQHSSTAAEQTIGGPLYTTPMYQDYSTYQASQSAQQPQHGMIIYQPTFYEGSHPQQQYGVQQIMTPSQQFASGPQQLQMLRQQTPGMHYIPIQQGFQPADFQNGNSHGRMVPQIISVNQLPFEYQQQILQQQQQQAAGGGPRYMIVAQVPPKGY